MDQDTVFLMGFAALIVANRAVFVGGFAARFRPAFYLVQLGNLAGSSFFLGWGISSFNGEMKVVNYMLGGLLILHAVKNNGKYAKLLRAQMDRDSDGFKAKRQEVLDKLKREPSDDA